MRPFCLPFLKLPLLSFSEHTQGPSVEPPGSSSKHLDVLLFFLNKCNTFCLLLFFFPPKVFRNSKAGNWRVLAGRVKAMCLLQQYPPTSWFCFPVICSGFVSGPLSSPSAKYLLIIFFSLFLWKMFPPPPFLEENNLSPNWKQISTMLARQVCLFPRHILCIC